jgi:nicotinamidase-related amidase
MKEFKMEDVSNLFDSRKAGLLVIDVQEKLWPFIAGQDEVLKRVNQAIGVAKALEMPILVTEQYVKGLGPTIPEVKSELEKFGAYNPYEKFTFSCMGESDFAAKIEETGLETLAIVGIEAHVCVMQTALEVLDRGLDAFYIAEATGSRNAKHKEEAVIRVRDAGALVGSVEMFAFEAMRTSKNACFKAVQKVII